MEPVLLGVSCEKWGTQVCSPRQRDPGHGNAALIGMYRTRNPCFGTLTIVQAVIIFLVVNNDFFFGVLSLFYLNCESFTVQKETRKGVFMASLVDRVFKVRILYLYKD